MSTLFPSVKQGLQEVTANLLCQSPCSAIFSKNPRVFAYDVTLATFTTRNALS